MADYRITDRERYALRGLPHLARLVYYEALRPYMDYRTGSVGLMRGISYQSIAEELYVEPTQGRHTAGTGSPTEKAIRNALERLVQAGLLRKIPAERRLVFELLEAPRDNSVRNMRGRGGADPKPAMSGSQETSHSAGRQEMKGRGGADPKTPMRGTPPESGNNSLSTPQTPHDQPTATACPLPADWTLPDTWRVWGERERPDLDISREEANFRDTYHGEKTHITSADWAATWRKWIRNARQSTAGKQARRGQHETRERRYHSAQSRNAEAERAYDERRGRERQQQRTDPGGFSEHVLEGVFSRLR